MNSLVERTKRSLISSATGLLQLLVFVTYQPATGKDINFSENTKLSEAFKNILPAPKDSKEIRSLVKGKVPARYFNTKQFLITELDVCNKFLKAPENASTHFDYKKINEYNTYIVAKNEFINKFKALKDETANLFEDQDIRRNRALNEAFDKNDKNRDYKPIPRTLAQFTEDTWAIQDIILDKYNKIYSEFIPKLEQMLAQFDAIYSKEDKLHFQQLRFDLLSIMFSLHNINEHYWIKFHHRL